MHYLKFIQNRFWRLMLAAPHWLQGAAIDARPTLGRAKLPARA